MLDEADAPVEEEEEDPIVEECIKDALGPYLGLLSPEEIADHRSFLVAFITTHPAAVPLYDRLRKRPTNIKSGETVRDGAPVEAEAEDVGNGTVGGRR
jgi:hypothetical protein